MALTTAPTPAATATTRTIVAPGFRDRRRPSDRLLWGIPSKIFTARSRSSSSIRWYGPGSPPSARRPDQPDRRLRARQLRKLANFQAGIWVYIGNSLFVSLLTVFLTLLVSFLGGYAFARFTFPGKNVLFLSVLAILMVPYATLLIPLYVILNAIGLQNSLVGVALVLTMFQLPFSMFMMRISFESVPRELDEAALVDGCTSLTALWRVLLPAVKPGLITVGLFAFLTAWNDFIAPLILINDQSKITLPWPSPTSAVRPWA